jgi:hypothetical protein
LKEQSNILSSTQKVSIFSYRYRLDKAGIPIKRSPTISAETALHLSFLITDYWSTAKKVIQSDLKMGDVPLGLLRISSKRSAYEQPSKKKSSSFKPSVLHWLCRWRSDALPCAKLREKERRGPRGEEGSTKRVIVQAYLLSNEAIE